MQMFTSTSLVRWNGNEARTETDEVVAEEPLEIRVGGRGVSVTMRTPGHDTELAAGFLLSEGLIHKRPDIVRFHSCAKAQNLLNVALNAAVAVDLEKLTRHVFAASSCGLCGKATIDAIRAQLPPLSDVDLPQIPATLIASMPGAMRNAQGTFDRTGGLHAAAVFDERGRLVVVREDVGRHNAVDKVLGYALLNDLLPLDRHVLVVSGRSSFEIMQKALAGRIPIVAAVSAPSSLAVDFARENRQTLIGFLRDNRMNVYCGDARIDFVARNEHGSDESLALTSRHS
ncbi:MAG TPA: formate dehydrogenase accessory sulfurtransferase FdhD [Planctomycetaceae bacterium]|jgi:FdhD protein|nr:formate dehydrogenase accessory sulfurtransferase FdhD [Planctomycetaceae bacterium]